ncbi:crossover junction endodeoxyribonuclease RuvC, partial [Thermosynechococcus sp.]|uniref:crossover junction endodeoxyribonuclease RuvC n=1 Tax=Thermosynechococcus sp. TaxID=2814275 RepID=UPI003919165A
KIARLYEYLNNLSAEIIAYESTVLRAMNGRIMDQLSGAVEAYALMRNVQCLAISPTAVRKSLLGKGNKKKEDIQEYIKGRFHIPCNSSHHELDALAVALCAQNLL